jgi:hypothetical protein
VQDEELCAAQFEEIAPMVGQASAARARNTCLMWRRCSPPGAATRAVARARELA